MKFNSYKIIYKKIFFYGKIKPISLWQKAQRAAEQQRRMAQESALHQERERLRQEYLQRNRMYERIGINPSSSSAAGSGGGRLRQPNVVSNSNQATLHWSFDSDNNILYYFVYNFGTNQLSEIKEVSLDNSPNTSPITEGGFFLQANNDSNSTTDMLFIDLNGTVIWQDSSDNISDVDIENFSKYVGAYYLKDGNWKLVVFDKDSNIKTFNFGENLIEGGGYSYDDVWSDGIVVAEYIGTVVRYYIINITEETKTQFYEVDNDAGDYLGVIQYAYSNKILTVKNNYVQEVFSSTGEKLAEFDAITEFATDEWYVGDFTFLDDNGSFLIFGYDVTNNDYTLIFFSGSTNTFSTKIIDASIYNYYYDMYDQKEYEYTNDWNAGGSAIFLFYETASEQGEFLYFSPEALLLPIWSSDSELRNFYTFSNTRGIITNFDYSNLSFSRSTENICLLIDNDSEDDNYSILRFNRVGDVETILPTDVNKLRALDDDDQINGKTILHFERGLTNSGSWGWSDLSDVETRFYYSLKFANNNQIGNYIIGQELVMKDVVNDQYWAIKFTDWQEEGGGGFAYTRQLISGGTFSGDLITFTFSEYIQEESDIISEGVLEFRRAFYRPIYNSAKEGESNGYNPSGTLWNSQWVYNLSESYQYKWFYTDGSASNPTNSTDFNALFSVTPEDSGREYGIDINWTSESGIPNYLPSENFAWQVDCLLKVDVPGEYLFNTTSDDGNQLTINGNVVTEFYGGRAFGEDETSEPIILGVGLHTFRYRMQQGDGSSGARVQWQGPEDGTFSVIPTQNLVINDPITEYDHYIIGTDGQIIGTVSTGSDYYLDYRGKIEVLSDNIFNKTWISNTQNSQNWTLLDKYYDEFESVYNIISEDGINKGIILAKNGYDYRIITEDRYSNGFSVPITSYLNKVNSDGIFYKGVVIRTLDEYNEWIRFYDMNGNLIDTIETTGTFFDFNSWLYGDRCVIGWEQDGTSRFAFFNGESVQ